jgi:hypothetical protein
LLNAPIPLDFTSETPNSLLSVAEWRIARVARSRDTDLFHGNSPHPADHGCRKLLTRSC